MQFRTVALLAVIASPIASPIASLHAQAPTPPRVFEVSPAVLAKIKQTQDPAIIKAVRADADKAMKLGPWSVMDKSMTPTSGDKHDYMSLARYFWPNPDTPNHLPYVRHDGLSNPEIKTISDEAFLDNTVKSTHQLALAYYLTGDEKYAARASLLLHVWFLDPATKMNPNLQFAQAIRGVNDGRGTGILDARPLPRACDAVGLLAGSPSWTAADNAAITAWFEQYYTWLTTSPHGHDEAAAKNNHGSWYDVQATGIALFLGKTDDARKFIETAKTKRIALQFKPDGSQPLELARTNSYHYSAFNLTALSELSQLGDAVGVDLWHTPPTATSSTLQTGLDFLIPVANGKPWIQKELLPIDPAVLAYPLLIATLHLGDPKYAALAHTLGKPDTDTLILESALPKASATK